MLEMIYGRSGSGKSDELFRRASASAAVRHVFILVPDRDAVSAERRVSKLENAGNIDVVTFRRLANYIFRSLGGICENYISAGEKKVVMQSVIEDMQVRLAEFSGVSPTDTYAVETFIDARREMMINMISPEQLSDAALRIPGKTGRKTADLSAIFSEFDSRVARLWRDPDGMLVAAAAKDGVERFFSESDIFIDAFTSYTAPQYLLIEKMISGSPRVAITLAYEPDEDKDEPAFATLFGTDEKLSELAKKNGVKVKEPTTLHDALRFDDAALKFLSANMWSSGKVFPHYDENTDALRVFSAADAYAEAEAVAIDISKTLARGARLRDIAVVARDTEEYRGIIDAVLDKYEIPYFVSEKTDVSGMALIKFIMSALNMRERGFAQDEFIRYIKTEFCDLSPAESFALENYLIKWRVSGKRLLSDFLENPRGLGYDFTDDDARALDAINDARRRTVEPLERFFGVAKNAATVKDNATVLFDFLSSLGVPEKLSASAKASRERGDDATAVALSKLWRALCDALDGIVHAVGDRECTPEQFRVYLCEMLSECDIGRIPTSVDRVLIADAVLARVEAKYVYIIGAYDGGFPRSVGDDGIFSEREKEELSRVGVEISSRLWRKLSEEMYHFYTAALSTSHTLTLSYPRRCADGRELEMSLGLKRICELFPKIEVKKFEDLPISERIYGRRASLDAAINTGGNLGRALEEYYEHDPEYADRLKNSKIPLSSRECRLGEDIANSLFGRGVSTSPSELEQYIKCRFMYFCEKQLKLSDDRPASFNEVDIGTFMHKIMEITVKFTVEKPDATDEEIDDVIRKSAYDLLGIYVRDGATARLSHLADYLCKSARAFVDETRKQFSQGKFRPEAFELKIDKNGDVAPLEFSSDGKKITVRGKIDRVDAYRGDDGKYRVIVSDYKTGSTKFDASKVELGLNMQMLLYLLALSENGEKHFGGEVVPSGVIYLGIKPPEVKLAPGESASVQIERSGVVLGDMDVVRALDETLEGGYLPASKKEIDGFLKDNAKESAHIISSEAFDKLLGTVKDVVVKFTSELCQGIADARPVESKEEKPCKYCRFAPICRSANIDESDEEDEEN